MKASLFAGDRTKKAPGPRPKGLLGILPEMRRDPLGTFLRASLQYGDIVHLPLGPIHGYLLRNPDHVRHVLVDNHQNYGKQTRGFQKLRDILGQGLLTSEGSFWLRQRRLAQPAFHRQKIAGFASIMVRAAEDAVASWRRVADTGATIDVAVEMNKLTMRIVAETLLGADVPSDAEAVGEAFSFISEDTRDTITNIFAVPRSIPTARNRRFKKAVAVLDEVVMRFIEERRRTGRETNDLLGMLMHARDPETGEAMNDRQLRDEVLTIFLAGHETTANALTWTFYLLSRSPHAFRTLHAELLEALGDRLPTADDLPRLRYAEMVVQESMRLYPPAWMIARSATNEDVIAGHTIPKGAFVFVSPWVSHRNPAVWENPEGFDPERFAPDAWAKLPRFAYFPFGGGPRICIGNNFAMMEATLLLATIAQRVRLDLLPGHPVEPQPLITLRPRYGMLMTVHSLESSRPQNDTKD